MQNRYFGDVGDFGKYGLLRKLTGITASGGPQLSLGVVWYLVPDEGHNDDGKHVSYLQKQEYAICDQELYGTLRHYLGNHDRQVGHIQRSSLLPSTTEFFDQPLTFSGMPIIGKAEREARLSMRAKWVGQAIEAVRNLDIIFLDPDNGLEIKSVKAHADKGPKYVYWSELDRFLSTSKTLVVYHHLNRTMPSLDQIRIRQAEIEARIETHTAVTPVLFKRGSHRVFFVIHAPEHELLTKARIEEIHASSWSQHLDVL